MKIKDSRPGSADSSTSAPPDRGSGGQAGQVLRRQAEEVVRETADLLPENLEVLSPEETLKMFHELQVHQIELEMQNEELRTKQAELDAARARYFDLYNLAPVGYCTVNEKGLIRETNLTAATLLGVARDKLVNQPIARFIHYEDQTLYYLHRKKLFETGELQTFELRMMKKDGTAFWASLSAIAAQDADGAALLRIVISDITNRKQAEAAQRESEDRYTIALNAASDGIWDWHIPDGSAFMSPLYYSLLGYEDGEFPASYASWRSLVHPEDIGRVERILQQSVEKGEGFAFDHRMKVKSGEWLWVSGRGKAIELDAEGKALRMAGTLSDITDRKRSEEYREMGREVLQLLNEPRDLKSSIRRVLAAMKTRTGFDAMSIRLQDGDDFPFLSRKAFPTISCWRKTRCSRVTRMAGYAGTRRQHLRKLKKAGGG